MKTTPMTNVEPAQLPWDRFAGSSICGVLLDENAVGVWHSKHKQGHTTLFVLHKPNGKYTVTGRLQHGTTGERNRVEHTNPFDGVTESMAIRMIDRWITTSPGFEHVDRFLMKDYTPESFAKEFMARGLVKAEALEIHADDCDGSCGH